MWMTSGRRNASVYLILPSCSLLNAFFVLAEFAAVKMRPTQVEALAETGNRRAKTLERIQAHLDEYLSVCQVGITLASIGLGFVGEPAFATSFSRSSAGSGYQGWRLRDYGPYHFDRPRLPSRVVSAYRPRGAGSEIPGNPEHGEGGAAHRVPDGHLPLRLHPPIWLLNATVNAILRLFRLPPCHDHGAHSEEEIRIILDQSQTSGMLSFRRLLHIENVLDMGVLTVRNAMRARRLVRTLSLGHASAERRRDQPSIRLSRYPLLGDDPEKPLGYVHVKDLLPRGARGKADG